MKKTEESPKIHLTEEGLNKIKNELKTLIETTRPAVVERLSLARSQGDLSENTEYAAAREQLAFLDGRVEELEEVIKNSHVVGGSHGACECVCFGCKVTVTNNRGNYVYHVVGDWEADPSNKKVSHNSPLGQALMKKKVGEQVEFDAPAGKVVFKIVKID